MEHVLLEWWIIDESKLTFWAGERKTKLHSQNNLRKVFFFFFFCCVWVSES